MFTRRHTLAMGAAALAAPALAQADPWAALRQRIAEIDRLRGVIVLQNGEERVAERANGRGLNSRYNVKSVSKTFVATLLGAAIDRGVIPSVNTTIAQAAPRLIPAAADPRARDITMEDLVTLRAGLERTSGGNYGEWISSSNWVSNALARPMIAKPGGRMLYSTGSTHILGAVLAEASGQSLLTLARRWLGDPLGIEIPAWTRDPQGYYLGGNEMALTPRAMARFGEMIRQTGAWNGTQVVSEAWITESFEPRTASRWSGLGYGYGWFLGRTGGTEYALARGYGGQIICVAPSIGLTIVIVSDPTQPARSGGFFSVLMNLIENEAIPAAKLS
ncbi:serine hydrolase domain-containing protein [Aestuariibius sp. 2305UL40-4]|uniref:serine hydrolase domain-containing protein n=1 Tax=Aestuariibius violaceus TaxID=3234132 RepID=UPI00345E308A